MSACLGSKPGQVVRSQGCYLVPFHSVGRRAKEATLLDIAAGVFFQVQASTGGWKGADTRFPASAQHLQNGCSFLDLLILEPEKILRALAVAAVICLAHLPLSMSNSATKM